MTSGPDRKEKAFTPTFTPHHTEGVLLAKENPPREFDDVGEFALTPLRNTDSDLRESKQEKFIVYLKGWRLHVLTAALCLSLFLSTIETTIVSTSVVSITNALNGFQKGNWIVTSYLLTYSGFLIILSRCSDIFGRKPLIILAILLFTIFSIGCGAAQTFTDLAILRAFQGIGGGGIYALVFVISFQMVPLERLASLSAVLSSAYAFSAVLGPILGGLISEHTTWRWVFFMNGPPGAAVLVMLLVSMPANFPYQSKSDDLSKSFTIQALKRVDFLGAFLILAASILFVSAVEEGGTEYSWTSAVVLSLLSISVILWILFFVWQRLLTNWQNICEPVLPGRLLTDRFTLGFLLNSFFGGAIFIPVVIDIPQRFQVVNNLSAFGAGWRLLALMVCSPLGSGVSGYLVARIKMPAFYIFLVAAILQIIGLALMGTLSISDSGVQSVQYGYQVILGLGIGLTLSSILIAAPTVVVDNEAGVSLSPLLYWLALTSLAVFVGALTQARTLGGSIGLAVCTNILNDKVKSESTFLSPQQLHSLLQSAEAINTLPANLQERVRQIYGMGYNKEMQALTAFGGAAVLATFLMWEKKLRRMQ